MPHVKSKDGWLSVTEVLNLTIDKPYLRYWYGKEGTAKCEQIKRESQEIGIEVHQLVEERFKDNAYTAVEGTRPLTMVRNFWSKFVIPYEVKPIKLEETYEDKKLKLQGTVDAIIDTNKGQMIADWKTSNQLDKISIPLQLSAYAKLCGEGVWQGVAVRIDKKSDKVDILEFEDLAPYWEIFKECIKVARYIKFGLEDK